MSAVAGRRRREAAAVVHLELHTHDGPAAGAFYGELLRWRTERITVGYAAYHAIALGGELDGGIVQCGVPHPLWVPYVEVDAIGPVTERGRELGASVLLEPREGPAGWRSVLATPAGGEIALWQSKRRPDREAP